MFRLKPQDLRLKSNSGTKTHKICFEVFNQKALEDSHLNDYLSRVCGISWEKGFEPLKGFGGFLFHYATIKFVTKFCS